MRDYYAVMIGNAFVTRTYWQTNSDGSDDIACLISTNWSSAKLFGSYQPAKSVADLIDGNVIPFQYTQEANNEK